MKTTQNFYRLALCYLFIFSFFQFTNCLPDQTSSSLKENQISDIPTEKLILSPLLNPGEILGYFNPGNLQDSSSISLVISKDGKTLFSMFNFDLIVYNISNPANQQRIGSLRYIGGWSISLLLSPDEKTLYLYGSERLRVINVTNPTSPAEIGYKETEHDGNSVSTQIISSDGKTLYTVNDQYLIVWDVSNPRHPSFLDQKEGAYAGGIAISKDNKRLAVGLRTKFQIYNIEDPEEIKSISTKSTNKGEVYAIAFSEDEKKLFLGVDKSKNVACEPNIEIYNITNLKSPSLIASNRLAPEATKGRLWFHSNKEYAFFTTAYEFKMVRISDFQQITLFSSATVTTLVPFTATPDNQINVVYSSDNIIMMNFNIDVASSSFLHFKPNALKVIDEIDYDRRPAMAISKEGKNIFLIKNGLNRNYTASVMPYELNRGTSSYQKLNPIPNLEAAWGKPFDNDALWNLVLGKDMIMAIYMPDRGPAMIRMIDTTNKNASYQFTNWNEKGGFSSQIQASALTGNSQSVIFVNETESYPDKKHSMTLNILTLNNRELKPVLKDFKMPDNFCYIFAAMKMSQNDKILFYANCDLLIYSLADYSSPILESQVNLSISRAYGLTYSKDQKVLYVFGLGLNRLKNLQIFDISDIKAPILLSRLEMPSQLISEGTDLIEISPDEKILYLGFKDGVLRVDIRVPNSPVLFGYNYFLQRTDAERLVNNTFYTSSYTGVTAFNISSEYILHIKNPSLKIGGSYSKALNVLELNKNLKFDFMMKKHKFLKVNIFDNSVSLNEESSFKTLPNWITFDQDRSLLKIEPNLPTHNGTYKISVILTTQTEPSAFVGLENITSLQEAKELMLNLIQSGYIDNHGYISGDLDLSQEIWIQPKYQAIEREVRAILSGNFIQAIGEIFVSSSLSLSETKPLKISSLSKSTVHVTIQFDQNQNRMRSPRFLDHAYSSLKPTIVNSKSLLILEGPLEDINEALQEIVVDLEGVCDGEISINDGINPPVSRRIPALSNYLHINDKPEDILNNLQAQIDSSPFYTGLYSSYDINASTFSDKNNLALDYSLELEDTKKGLPPTWIAIKGLTLMATPPETYYRFSYKFILRVSNQFQSIAVPFTLNVRISFYYAMKLAATFFGYTISLFGFIYSMNKAYNVIARKYYRHPRSFKLKVGEKINDLNLFPVSFIRSETIKSKNLFNALERYVKRNHRCSLLEYFVDSHSQILNQQKIIDTLKSMDHNNAFDNDTADSFSARTIQQLVVNRIIMEQLSTRQEAKTRQVFNEIKKKWMDLVISSHSPAQFVINSENLDRVISDLSFQFAGGENLNETHFESSENLLDKSSINIDLLTSAIIAHAFSYQNIDIDLILIDVISYKRIKGRTFYLWLKKLLLRNLKPFVFLNKREIGCGIEYKIDENTLHFSGRLTHELKNDTIVIHLKNHRGRILREFWIVGDHQAIQSEQSYIHNISENL